MSWQQAVQERQEIVLSTASENGNPHAIIVISLGLVDKKVLIGACQMKKTLANIKKITRLS